MNKFWMVAMVAALGLTGCVSAGKFKTLETERDELKAKLAETSDKAASLEDEKAGLEASNEDLSVEKDSLTRDKKSLNEEKNALAGDKEALLAERARLAGEKEALEKQNAVLLKAQEDSKAQYDNVLGQLNKEVQEGNLKLTQFRNMLAVDVAEQLFFNSGSAELKEQGRDVLLKVAKVLNQYPDKYIRVSGHTDNVPVGKGSKFGSNWELSVARATNVVRFMQDKSGVDGHRLVAAGRASFDPVASNDTKEGRQKNRRIEIVLMDKALFESTQPSSQGNVAK